MVALKSSKDVEASNWSFMSTTNVAERCKMIDELRERKDVLDFGFITFSPRTTESDLLAIYPKEVYVIRYLTKPLSKSVETTFDKDQDSPAVVVMRGDSGIEDMIIFTPEFKDFCGKKVKITVEEIR